MNLEDITGDLAAAARALIQDERDAAIAGDLATLHALWTEDARIVDGRGTVDEADDYMWQGRDAIMDRYELAVLPAPPPPFDPAYLSALRVEALTEEVATAEIGVDRWTLMRVNGRWQLSELRYN